MFGPKLKKDGPWWGIFAGLVIAFCWLYPVAVMLGYCIPGWCG